MQVSLDASRLGQEWALRDMLEERHLFAMRFDTFRDIGDGLVEVFGVEVATVILYQAGRSAGTQYYERALRRAGSKEALLKSVGLFKEWRGWGEITFVDVNGDEATGKVIVTNCFECKAGAKTRGCPFFRGYFAGFLSRFFGREICVTQQQPCTDGCVFPFMPSKFRHETPVRVQLKQKVSRSG